MSSGLGLLGSAFVTGAASGIGKSTALAFAHHGVRQLALGDIDAATLGQTASQIKASYPDIDIMELQLNVSSESEVEAAVKSVVERFGRLDIAVNNAGIAGPTLPTPNVDFQAWKSLFDVNLHGVWLCQRAEIRQMLTQSSKGPRSGRGVIINVASMLGVTGTTANATAYSASKHAIVGLTKSDANSFSREGIRINAICPGYIETPLLAKASEAGFMAEEIAKTPMQRLGKMEEVADCITFLASPMASFITGATLVADGGFTAGSNYRQNSGH